MTPSPLNTQRLTVSLPIGLRTASTIHSRIRHFGEHPVGEYRNPPTPRNTATIMGVVALPKTGFYRTTLRPVSYIRIHMNENKKKYNGEVRTTNCFVIRWMSLYMQIYHITITFHVSYIERIYTVEKGGKQYTDSRAKSLKQTPIIHTPAHIYFLVLIPFAFYTCSVFSARINGHTGISGF